MSAPPPVVRADPGDALRTPLHVARSAVELILSGDAGPVGGDAITLLTDIAAALDELEDAVQRLLAERQQPRTS